MATHGTRANESAAMQIAGVIGSCRCKTSNRSRSSAFRILRTDRGFRVHGQAGSQEELEQALREAGAKTGDEVQVEGEVLEFQ